MASQATFAKILIHLNLPFERASFFEQILTRLPVFLFRQTTGFVGCA
jgi:hypothetical protein